MKPSEHIINVNENDFQYEVLAFSNQTPVVVDFWAEWCGPCKLLSPTLEKLADEGAGSFRLAKVDVDANPALAASFGIRSIPALLFFQDGKVVEQVSGAAPKGTLAGKLRNLLPVKS